MTERCPRIGKSYPGKLSFQQRDYRVRSHNDSHRKRSSHYHRHALRGTGQEQRTAASGTARRLSRRFGRGHYLLCPDTRHIENRHDLRFAASSNSRLETDGARPLSRDVSFGRRMAQPFYQLLVSPPNHRSTFGGSRMIRTSYLYERYSGRSGIYARRTVPSAGGGDAMSRRATGSHRCPTDR